MPWTPPAEWTKLRAGVDCPTCTVEVSLDENEFSYKIAEFEHTYVRLPKNQYQRGWTIVVRKRHANELYELTESELAAFWRDVARVASALDCLYRPAKINYAVFGNLCPHVHCHLVLQTFADDPHAPLNMTAHEVLLEEEEYREAIRTLRMALT